MQKNNNIDVLYGKYHGLVKATCKKFTKNIPNEDIDDLTQMAWEQIIKKHPNFDANRGSIKTWIVMVCKSTMYNIIRDNNRDKRSIHMDAISIDSLTDGKDKYL